MEKKKIIVCGATGLQGTAVIKALQESNSFEIVALSRDPSSEKSRKLLDIGLEVVKADLQGEQSLIQAFEGAYGVFGVTQPWSPDYKVCDTDAEIEQGKCIVKACKVNDIKHLVFSSMFMVGTREEMSKVNHAESKIIIEDEIKSQNIPYTILRPVAFMNMLGNEHFPITDKSTTGIVGIDVKLPWVHTDDIGAMVRIAFEDPDKYIGQVVGLIGDFLTGRELINTISEIKNVSEYKYKSAPTFVLWLISKLGIMPTEFYQMHLMYTDWGTPPYPPSIEEDMKRMEEIYPNKTTVKDYLLTRESN